MAKCNQLTPLPFKGLNVHYYFVKYQMPVMLRNWRLYCAQSVTTSVRIRVVLVCSCFYSLTDVCDFDPLLLFADMNAVMGSWDTRYFNLALIVTLRNFLLCCNNAYLPQCDFLTKTKISKNEKIINSLTKTKTKNDENENETKTKK